MVYRLGLFNAGRDYIGGRTRSADGLDLGAHWIHGTDGNPLAELCEKMHLELHLTGGNSTYPGGPYRIQFYDPMGPISDVSRDIAYTTYQRICHDVHEFEENLRARAKGNDMEEILADYESSLTLADAFETVVRDRYPFLHRSQAAREDLSRIRWHLQLECRDDLGEDAERLSWWYHDAAGRTEVFQGENACVSHKQGMSALTTALAKGLDIYKADPIAKVEYGLGGKQVTVTTRHNKSHTADACIVTLPIGVLQKEKDPVIFDPPLPAEKVQAIQRLGSATVNKVFLEFDRVFWPQQHYAFAYIDTDNFDDSSVSAGAVGMARDGKPAAYPRLLINYYRALGRPVLGVVCGGEDGRRIELRTMDENRDWVMRLVRRLFGPDSPMPKHVSATSWGTDPMSLGSVPCMPVGTRPDDVLVCERNHHSLIIWLV